MYQCINISALFYFQLMSQLREKHPDRFDVPVPAAQCRPPRESDSDSEHEQTTLPTGTQTEEAASTSSQRTPAPPLGRGSRLIFSGRGGVYAAASPWFTIFFVFYPPSFPVPLAPPTPQGLLPDQQVPCPPDPRT